MHMTIDAASGLLFVVQTYAEWKGAEIACIHDGRPDAELIVEELCCKCDFDDEPPFDELRAVALVELRTNPEESIRQAFAIAEASGVSAISRAIIGRRQFVLINDIVVDCRGSQRPESFAEQLRAVLGGDR